MAPARAQACACDAHSFFVTTMCFTVRCGQWLQIHLRITKFTSGEVKLYEIAISLADQLVFEGGCKIQIGRAMWESPGARRAANGAVCTRTVSV